MSRARHIPRTRGGKALQDWLANERRSQDWIANQIRHEGEDLHQATVSAWIGGRKGAKPKLVTPNTHFAVRLEELTGIPVRWWTELLESPEQQACAE